MQQDSFHQSLQHHLSDIGGLRLHYVIAGKGDPVLLLAGFPESWYAWRRVMPSLAEHYTIIAVDLPGQGDSDKPERGYDTKSLAAAVHALMADLQFTHYFVAAHDVGAWVAYPYAAMYGDEVSKLVLMEASIPGVTLLQAIPTGENGWKSWHFLFHAIPDLPEELIAGHERAYVTWFLRTKSASPITFSEEDISEYERSFVSPGGVRAGLAYYRAIPRNIEDNETFSRTKLRMPVLALGGEYGAGSLMVEGARRVADDVQGGTVPNCGHYIPEEAPDVLTKYLLRFFAIC